MNKLDLCPLQESYSVKYGTSVERIAFRGGFGRYIQTKNAKKHLVDVSFTLREDDFIYFRAFYLNWQLNPLPFLMSLIIEDSEFREYIAQFVPESFAFNELSGKIFKVLAQIVVVTSEVQILTSKPYPLYIDESINTEFNVDDGLMQVMPSTSLNDDVQASFSVNNVFMKDNSPIPHYENISAYFMMEDVVLTLPTQTYVNENVAATFLMNDVRLTVPITTYVNESLTASFFINDVVLEDF